MEHFYRESRCFGSTDFLGYGPKFRAAIGRISNVFFETEHSVLYYATHWNRKRVLKAFALELNASGSLQH
jgi:hypothetical protein